MTVSSLWNVLDDGGCGSPMGLENFNLRGDDVNNPRTKPQTILAVDLSIWICEGMASTALSSFHSDPSLYLVYQRTQKLLKLGLGLVFVVEGQRRVRSEQQTNTQQRKGSAFVNASKRCETMLRCLGVPVVRAEAEGEALCAHLNSSGIVDGVISNDGDCLLFGAKTIYTNFTCENLENRKVMRYDADKLVANISADTNNNKRSLKLSREDLIAFAILCGSDMVGSGIRNTGSRKTIQFLDACKSLKKDCLDELLLWSSKSSKSSEIYIDCDDDGPSTITSRCCSLCLHRGDKRSHEKHGCSECGTGPGEGCIAVSKSEKCIKTMKDKCLASSSVAPRNIVMEYFKPNNNNIPSSLNQLKSKPYGIVVDASALFTTSLIIKGKTKESSEEYVKQTIPSLLVRLDLWSNAPRNRYNTKQRFKPNPVRIEKSVVRQSIQIFYHETSLLRMNSASSIIHRIA